MTRLSGPATSIFTPWASASGFDIIAQYRAEPRAGKLTGIELADEKAGNIPTTAWKKQRTGEAWYPGDTYINSIGQGFVQVSPIQACQMIGAIANGGKFFQPTLLRQSRNRETGVVTPVTPEQKRAFKMDPAALAEIRRALLGVTTESNGTAHGAATPSRPWPPRPARPRSSPRRSPAGSSRQPRRTTPGSWPMRRRTIPGSPLPCWSSTGATAARQPRRWPEKSSRSS